MSILTGPEIKKAMKHGEIEISPCIEGCIGPYSVDVHLGSYISVYECTIPKGMLPAIPYTEEIREIFNIPNADGMRCWFEKSGKMDYYEHYCLYPQEYDPSNVHYLLDPCDEKCHKERIIQIPETGLLLNPRFLFISYIVEQVTSSKYHTTINGTSTIGRNGVSVHQTAEDIAVGFNGQIVLEMLNKTPFIVYPYMKIAQLKYSTMEGEIEQYNTTGYQNQTGPKGAKPLIINQQHSETLKEADSKMSADWLKRHQQTR